MNNALLRTLVIYAVCVVLAIWLGFLLAGPLTYSSLVVYGLLGFILVFPILLRWHYPLLLLSWNFAAVVLFVPGRPSVGLTMILLSLGISVLQRMINAQSRFISVPQITLPLLCLVGVVAFTAKMTGFGLRVFGSNIYGGQKYFYLIGGILGYFALSAQRIPPGRINLYLGLFLLGGLTSAVSDLIAFLPHQFYFIYWFFNYNTYVLQPQALGTESARYSGSLLASTAIFSFMVARYGLRGIFLSRKPWRWMVLILAVVYGCFGGFRSLLVTFALLFAIQFFLEGLHRTKLLPILLTAGSLGALALIPLADHLPYGFQRALSFLPYKVSTEAELAAQNSLNWRLDMWQALLPQIPQYLLLGKGYTINPLDYKFVMGPEASIHSVFAENDAMALAEDFHSGPLSVVIPFGIWGCLAFLWFVAAGAWAVYRNYRYGDPALQIPNTFLLAAFLTRILLFLFIGGDMSSDMMYFCGWLGLSVALNGGVARRVVRVEQTVPQPARPRGFVPAPASAAPAFQRRLPGTSR